MLRCYESCKYGSSSTSVDTEELLCSKIPFISNSVIVAELIFHTGAEKNPIEYHFPPCELLFTVVDQ